MGCSTDNAASSSGFSGVGVGSGSDTVENKGLGVAEGTADGTGVVPDFDTEELA
ncbi:hypothetical protein D3C76_379150 [compost metagenome]